MGLLDRGTAWLNRTLAADAGVSVTYTPLGGSAVTLRAVPGLTRDDSQQTTEPARVEWSELDLVVTAADWAAAGLTGEPKAGDRASVPLNGTAVPVEVRRRGTEPAWRYTDATRTAFRIHLKPV